MYALALSKNYKLRIAQFGSAIGLGPIGRRFESYFGDHKSMV